MVRLVAGHPKRPLPTPSRTFSPRADSGRLWVHDLVQVSRYKCFQVDQQASVMRAIPAFHVSNVIYTAF